MPGCILPSNVRILSFKWMELSFHLHNFLWQESSILRYYLRTTGAQESARSRQGARSRKWGGRQGGLERELPVFWR